MASLVDDNHNNNNNFIITNYDDAAATTAAAAVISASTSITMLLDAFSPQPLLSRPPLQQVASTSSFPDEITPPRTKLLVNNDDIDRRPFSLSFEDEKKEEDGNFRQNDDVTAALTSTTKKEPLSTCSNLPVLSSLRPSLSFKFVGYSIWLDLEGMDDDLTDAISYAAKSQNVEPIPAPHVTVVYGMTHLDVRTIQRRFQTTLRSNLLKLTTDDNRISWPNLVSNGLLADEEYYGINGGEMTMAWMEVTMKSSPEHEMFVDAVYDAFFYFDDDIIDDGDTTEHHQKRRRRQYPWKPHLSLCYDNPEGTSFSLSGAMDIIQKFPSLLDGNQQQQQQQQQQKPKGRKPIGLSLWSTEGTMDQWKRIDTIKFAQSNDDS